MPDDHPHSEQPMADPPWTPPPVDALSDDTQSEPDTHATPDGQDQAIYDVQDGHEHHVLPGHAPVEAVRLDPEHGSEVELIVPVEHRPRTRPKVLSESQEPKQPVWPEVLGVLCVFLAGSGMLIHGLRLMGHTLDLTDTWGYLGRDRPEISLWLVLPNVVIESVLLCIELMLLYGGLATKMRWRSAAATLTSWAMVKIVMVGVRLAWAWIILLVPSYRLWMKPDAGADDGFFALMLGLAWSLVMFIWGLLLPVFVLVWFRRTAIREEIQTWDGSGDE